MPDLKAQFGKRLKQLRRKSGLNQAQLAEKIDVTVETISNMERGIHGPKFDKLEKLAQVLNIPAKTLLESED